MSLTDPQQFVCPYCMSINDIDVDWAHDLGQTQIIDCQICCQPIDVIITEVGHSAEPEYEIVVKRDDE